MDEVAKYEYKGIKNAFLGLTDLKSNVNGRYHVMILPSAEFIDAFNELITRLQKCN